MSQLRSVSRRWLALVAFVVAMFGFLQLGGSGELVGPVSAQAHQAERVPARVDTKQLTAGTEGQHAEGSIATAAVQSEKRDAGRAHKVLDVFTMSMAALAGLVLFIFGVTQLAEGLVELNTEAMRKVVAKFTTNRLAGVATAGAVLGWPGSSRLRRRWRRPPNCQRSNIL